MPFRSSTGILHPVMLRGIECRTPAAKPKHFTAEFAKIAKVHQVSTTWARARRGSAAGEQHLDQNVPLSSTSFLPAVTLNMRDFFAALARFAVKMHFLCWAGIGLTRPGVKG